MSTRLSLYYFNLQRQFCLLVLLTHKLNDLNFSEENTSCHGMFLVPTFLRDVYGSQALGGQVMSAEMFSVAK